MNTLIWNMTAGEDQAGLERAGAILRNGGLVAFPTETVYGLGANALDAEASAKIYAAKGRPSDNPLIVHICETDALKSITEYVPESAEKLAAKFWPGPLTMILNKNNRVPKGTTGGLDTVAVRMPDHPIALAMIKAGGGYIAAPSANTSGRPSPTTAQHVAEDMNGRIDMIIDGGPVGIGLESTIVDLTGEIPTVLRPGYINLEMLREVLGTVELDQALLKDDPNLRPKAPGMKYRHYAPKANLSIVEGEREQVIGTINRLTEQAEAAGGKVGVIASDETAADYRAGLVKSVGTRSDELTIAMHLYGILREFDSQDVSVIYSEAFDTPQMGQAIMNRLVKAAGHQIIQASQEDVRNKGADNFEKV